MVLRGKDGVRSLSMVNRLCLGGLEEFNGCIGRGVVFESDMESLDLAIGRPGVLELTGIDFSDVGGEGGVRASDTSDDADFVGGVAIVGDEVDVVGDSSDNADCGLARSAINGGGFFRRSRSDTSSAWRSLSCLISASILRSLNSSRSLCVSILRASLSCSPALISSSAITPRSIATLYFDSRSSNDELVFRAWRSKSSFDTSMSRSRSCIVLLASRRVVISF